jgi:hypothetical protein
VVGLKMVGGWNRFLAQGVKEEVDGEQQPCCVVMVAWEMIAVVVVRHSRWVHCTMEGRSLNKLACLDAAVDEVIGLCVVILGVCW